VRKVLQGHCHLLQTQNRGKMQGKCL
jgi:hypothetical protein